MGNEITRWDRYYLDLAIQTASVSRCIKRQVGAVIVNENNKVVALGHNGRPQKTECDDKECLRKDIPSGERQDILCCLHAELNACIFAGIDAGRNGTIYLTHSPCLLCSPMLLQMMFKRIVFWKDHRQDGIQYILGVTKRVTIDEYDPENNILKRLNDGI